jgi:hypothetical protein
VAVVTSVFSRRIRNCNAVNGKDALKSAILKEKKQKEKKNGVRRKGEYEVANLETGYVFVRIRTYVSYVGKSVVISLEGHVCMIILMVIIPWAPPPPPQMLHNTIPEGQQFLYVHCQHWNIICKLCGLSPRVNYIDRATPACQQN